MLSKVSSNDKDASVEINYTANDQTAKIYFVNTADHTDIVKTQTVDGKTGETVKLSQDGAEGITKLAVPEGWTIVPGTQTPEAISFGSTPIQDQTVYIEHKKDTESGLDDKNKDNTNLRRQVTRTVVISVPGQKDQEIPQTVDLYRTKTVDKALKAEGKSEDEYTTYSEWKSNIVGNKTSFDEVNVSKNNRGEKLAVGYTPTANVALEDKNGAKFVPAQSALQDGEPVTNYTVIVDYHKNGDTPVPYKPGKDGVDDGMNKCVTRIITVKEPGKNYSLH